MAILAKQVPIVPQVVLAHGWKLGVVTDEDDGDLLQHLFIRGDPVDPPQLCHDVVNDIGCEHGHLIDEEDLCLLKHGPDLAGCMDVRHGGW